MMASTFGMTDKSTRWSVPQVGAVARLGRSAGGDEMNNDEDGWVVADGGDS
jgi:hypothetical protein